jgi:hypothetical protein
MGTIFSFEYEKYSYDGMTFFTHIFNVQIAQKN